MKKVICTIVAALALLLAAVSPGQAFRGGHGGHGGHFGRGGHVNVGFFVGGPFWGPGWWGPYYPSYPYYAPQTVVVQQPVTYSQQTPEQNYWYFCRDPEGYFPYVRNCPNGWLKVVPYPGDAKE